MSNKTFNVYHDALRAFTTLSRLCECYLIHNIEDDVYEVITPKRYSFYERKRGLDFDLLHVAH